MAIRPSSGNSKSSASLYGTQTGKDAEQNVNYRTTASNPQIVAVDGPPQKPSDLALEFKSNDNSRDNYVCN